MAISPIDLQTLFTQVDKVGKQETAQREGLAIQQALQQAQSQRQTEEKIRSVNEAPDQGEGAEVVRDLAGGRNDYEGEGGKREGEEEQAEKKDDGIIRDPALGKNIDVSL